MKIASVIEMLFAQEDISLFENVRDALKRLDNTSLRRFSFEQEPVLSAEIIAKALAQKFGMSYVHGTFGKYIRTCWLKTPAGHIIDIRPCGIYGTAVLVHTDSPFAQMYSAQPSYSYHANVGSIVERLVTAISVQDNHP